MRTGQWQYAGLVLPGERYTWPWQHNELEPMKKWIFYIRPISILSHNWIKGIHSLFAIKICWGTNSWRGIVPHRARIRVHPGFAWKIDLKLFFIEWIISFVEIESGVARVCAQHHRGRRRHQQPPHTVNIYSCFSVLFLFFTSFQPTTTKSSIRWIKFDH